MDHLDQLRESWEAKDRSDESIVSNVLTVE